MNPDFIDDLGPEDKANALKFLAALDEYRETHTDEEFDRLVDLFKLVDQMENEPALAGAGFLDSPLNEVAPKSDNSPRVDKSDNPLGIKAKPCPWGTWVGTTGTRDELINSKLCADYMFDQLGEKNARSGPTEYGDRFTLQRRSNQRYQITLWLRPKARKPHGMASVDIYQTDISALLKQISGCAS